MPTASQYDRLCQLSAAPNDCPRGTHGFKTQVPDARNCAFVATFTIQKVLFSPPSAKLVRSLFP